MTVHHLEPPVKGDRAQCVCGEQTEIYKGVGYRAKGADGKPSTFWVRTATCPACGDVYVGVMPSSMQGVTVELEVHPVHREKTERIFDRDERGYQSPATKEPA